MVDGRYGLGPNGAITTCLNLFATKVDQILGIIDKRAPEHEYLPCMLHALYFLFTVNYDSRKLTEDTSLSTHRDKLKSSCGAPQDKSFSIPWHPRIPLS